ncbi:MAG: PAS domain S-box protein [Candidatus Cloacimonetes bacterium]|nr:PAS domain S-box protein [Candidatus Cloacimonadota bacterium]
MLPEEAKKIGEIFTKIISEKEPIVDLENWNITKDGKKICLLTNGKPLLNKNGDLIGYRGVDKDITERKKADEELNKKINELEKFQDITVDRELEMIKLKKEINSLCEKYGEKPKYKIDQEGEMEKEISV